jgi:DNA-binding IclR family transcriptional regulator
MAGISAMAAPVFDVNGRGVMSLTLIGPSVVFDATPDGPLATTLRSFAQMLSRRLGSPIPQPGV